MKKGDIVKFRKAVDPGDEDLRLCVFGPNNMHHDEQFIREDVEWGLRGHD